MGALDDSIVNDYIHRTGLTGTEEEYYTLLEGIGIIGRDEDNDGYHPTVGGLLIFGYDPQLYLAHTGIRLIDKLSASSKIMHYRGPIWKMLNDMEAYLKQRVSRIKAEYPVDAVIEAVANATIHRDYFSLGREIVVLLEGSRIEVSNPGVACGDGDIPALVKEYNPCRRNQWLYQRLLTLDTNRRFLQSGRGMERIYEAFRQHGGARIMNNEKRNLFKVVLPGPDLF